MPRAQDGDGPLPGLQCGPVGDGVDTPGQAADDGHSRTGYVVGQPVSGLTAVGGGPPGPDDCHGPFIFWKNLASDVQHRRTVVDLLQAGRVLVVVPGQCLDPCFSQTIKLGVGVDSVPAADDKLNGTGVESRRLQVRAPGVPGPFERAEVVLKQVEPGPADPWHAVE